jgi:hypothetical protein
VFTSVMSPSGLTPMMASGAASRSLGPLPLGDVADRGDDDHPPVDLDPRERYLGRKLGPAVTPARQLDAEAHRPWHGSLEIDLAQLRVIANRGRHQKLERPADQVIACVSEQHLRPRIHQHDAAVGVDTDDRVRDRLEERREERAARRRTARGKGHATGLSVIPRDSDGSLGRVRLSPPALARCAFSSRLAEIIRVMSSPNPTSGGSGSCLGVD